MEALAVWACSAHREVSVTCRQNWLTCWPRGRTSPSDLPSELVDLLAQGQDISLWAEQAHTAMASIAECKLKRTKRWRDYASRVAVHPDNTTNTCLALKWCCVVRAAAAAAVYRKRGWSSS